MKNQTEAITALPSPEIPRLGPRHYFKLASFLELGKARITLLVLISSALGFLAGHPFDKSFSGARFLGSMLGIALLSLGASALNQIQERTIDAQMNRTSGRPLPAGRLSMAEAWIFSLCSMLASLAVLALLGRDLFILGASAIILYNGLYTILFKPHSAFAAVPGAIPGALPVLIGYTAASGNAFEAGGLYLFFVLFFWQMPHFWSLALKYKVDYARGGIPTLPVTLGSHATLYYIVLWCLAYVGIAFQAPFFLEVGPVYLPIATLVSAKLLWELASYVKRPGNETWRSFFIWINVSLVIYLISIVADLWSVYLLIPLLT